MQLLGDMDGFTLIPIHAITRFEIECTGKFFEDTVNDCNTKDEFISLHGDCGGYADLVAYTADTSVRFLREPMTSDNFKTFKSDIIYQLEEILRNLGE